MTGLALHAFEDDHATLHALPVGVALYDRAGHRVLANAVFIRTLAQHGIHRAGEVDRLAQSVIDQSVIDQSVTDQAAIDQTAIDQTAEAPSGGHSTRDGRTQHSCPDGRVVGVRHVPLLAGAHLICLDEHGDQPTPQPPDDAARQRLGTLDSILQCIPHGIAVYGPDRRLRLINDAYARIMDGAPIAIGDTVQEVIVRRAQAGEFGPGDPDTIAAEQQQHDNTKPQLRRRQRPNGSTIDVRTAPLPGGGHISVVSDVTPLVSAEAELARRAASLDAMLAHIRHGIVLWDPDRRIVAANTCATTMLHAPYGLLVPGRTLADVVAIALERGTLGTGEVARNRASWLLEQDRGQSHLDQRQTRDGRVLEVRSDPTPDGGFVTTYTDVTQLRGAEEALILSKSAAEAANAAKSRFLAAMSTELCTPLWAILDQAGGIAKDSLDQLARERGRPVIKRGMDAQRIGDACEMIQGSARALVALVDTILDVARLEAGRFELADDVVALPQVLRSVLRQFDATAAASEVALVVDLPDVLPALRVDERRLRQSLSSVVSNAVKFTGAAGSVSIGARHDWTSGSLLIDVRDTGPGIPETELETVFEPFTQARRCGCDQPDEKRSPGAGLGLYIGRVLMRAHGGDLTLRSVIGQGTTATLHIPADRVLPEGLPDGLPESDTDQP